MKKETVIKIFVTAAIVNIIVCVVVLLIKNAPKEQSLDVYPNAHLVYMQDYSNACEL